MTVLPKPENPIVATHWGIYTAKSQGGGTAELVPFVQDPDPSPIGRQMLGAQDDSVRIGQPMVRRSFLSQGYGAGGEQRGAEPFVAVSWEEALNLVASELQRVRQSFGSEALFGGSYGWSSAGRFHHAQSQLHRFLNVTGGYVKSVQSYSFGAATILLPHVIGTEDGLGLGHTVWPSIIDNTKLILMFGGMPAKNAQVNAGGVYKHYLSGALDQLSGNGARLINVSPIAEDGHAQAKWLPIRPGTDVAFMLGLAHSLIEHDLHDRAFLDTYTTGYGVFEDYVLGRKDGIAKSPGWASDICGIAERDIIALAKEMVKTRCLIAMAWSLQRAHHGEQPYWMAITLAAMLGQIGLPGGGFGFGYGAVNGIGHPLLDFKWPSLAQKENPVSDYIPVARISDMLLGPGESYHFNGEIRHYPDIKLVYWAGGNPFHHHQDINRLLRAWKRPQTIIIHESWWNATARHADIVLPVATQLERNDIVCAARERMIVPSHKVAEPFGHSLTDFQIFTHLADMLGVGEAFCEGRDEAGWLRHFHAEAKKGLQKLGHTLPDFEAFWAGAPLDFPEPEAQTVLLKAFRDDPEASPLQTPSGKIEIHSKTLEAFGYDDCIGHPAWLPSHEWLGSQEAKQFPLHLISNQPQTKLHSQYDNGTVSRARKTADREPLRIHPADAKNRAIADGDVVRVFNDRGACLTVAKLSDTILRGVLELQTGAWYDPRYPGQIGTLDKHGNPNVLTSDRPTSQLAQATAAQSCLVEVEKWHGDVPEVTAFESPVIVNER